MIDWLIELTNRNEEQIAFTWQQKEITYSKFLTDIQSCIAVLIEENKLNQNESKNTILIGTYSYEWVVAFFSIIFCGKTVVPVDNTSVDQLDGIMKKLNATVSVTTENQILYNVNYQKIIITKDALTSGQSMLLSNIAKLTEDQVVAIFQTSGTTGNPKWVELTNNNLMTNISSVKEIVRLEGETIHFLPMHHSFSILALALGLSYGCHFHLIEHPRFLEKQLRKVSINYLITVPVVLENFYKLFNKEGMKADIRTLLGENITTIISGGAFLDSKYIDYFNENGITLLNGYGITECSPVIAVNSNKDKKLFNKNAVGHVLSCNQIKIVNTDSQGNGEICVKGSNVLKGYYGEEDILEDGWFNTKDIGYLDEEGFLFLQGRARNMIVLSNGENIFPEKLEKIFMDSELIDEALVFEKNGQLSMKIFSCVENDLIKLEDKLKKEIQMINYTLPYRENISSFTIQREAFKKTSTGKIIRK